jgi:hypothetical protein
MLHWRVCLRGYLWCPGLGIGEAGAGWGIGLCIV